MTFNYQICAAAIVILGAALRLIGLGEAPFHPDEAIHAFFSGGFGNYKYDPVYHGPLLYHLVSTVFEIFGQHNFAARLVPALLGIGLLGLVLGPMRPFLGNRGALASAALLAVSPSVVSYSRRLLHDSLALFLTLGAVWCLLLALENGANTERGRNARVGLAAFLTLFLATKANFFFIAVMLGAFYFAWRLAGRLKISGALTKWVPPLLFLIVSGAAIAFPRDNAFAEAIKTSQHHIFQIVAVLSCVLFGFWLLMRPPHPIEQENKANWRQSSDATTYILALAAILWLYVLLFGGAAQTVTQWVQSGQFPAHTFAQGNEGARSAIGKMLEYWGGQQQKPRLPGRHDYYFVLLLLYELPVFFAALGGIWHAAKHRSAFSDLLLWWAFTSWTVYALANEKVPWLLVHSVLPLALLGGLWLGQIAWKKSSLALAATAGLLFSLRGVSGVNFERAGDNVEPMLFAQTPDAFRDAVHETLVQTRGDKRPVWIAGERQWPSVWYFRSKAPAMGDSGTALAGVPTPNLYRAAVMEEAQWPQFQIAGWKGKVVDFWIWPRASW
ncbi:MAG: TIGR03663 family protein, partial [Armatimonadetes bacterium]|nr:TIGR03663 family protein [Armatimonadota bacterium]